MKVKTEARMPFNSVRVKERITDEKNIDVCLNCDKADCKGFCSKVRGGEDAALCEE